MSVGIRGDVVPKQCPVACPGIMLIRRGSRSTSSAPGGGGSITLDHQSRRWTFLTDHARVLLFIARNPVALLREVAAACRITECSAQRIVAELEQAGYLRRERVGQRTQYTVDQDRPLRHPAETGLFVRDLVKLLAGLAEEEADVGATQ